MDNSQYPSSLNFELRIIKAKNIDPRSSGDLFVRCYLPAAGNKQRVIKLDTHQISPKSNLIIWDQTYSLNCSSTEENPANFPKHEESIIFELRRRRIQARFLGRLINGSKLVGRADVTLKECVESRNMKIEKWVSMSTGRVREDLKPATVQIAVNIQESAEEIMKIDQNNYLRRWDGCCTYMDGIGCNSCNLDHEYFVLGSSV